MPATGSYSVGKSARNLVGRLQAYRCNQYYNSKHSGAISLSIIYSSMVLHRVNSVGRLARSLIIQLACDSRCISTIVVQFMVYITGILVRYLINSGLYAYWHKAYWVIGYISYNSYQVYSCRRYQQFFLLQIACITILFQPLPPLYYSLFTVPSMRTSCLNYTSSHLYSYLGNYRSLKIFLYAKSSEAY